MWAWTAIQGGAWRHLSDEPARNGVRNARCVAETRRAHSFRRRRVHPLGTLEERNCAMRCLPLRSSANSWLTGQRGHLGPSWKSPGRQREGGEVWVIGLTTVHAAWLRSVIGRSRTTRLRAVVRSGVHAVTARSQMATLRALLLCAGLGSALALRVPERGPASHLTRRAAMGAALLSVCAPADANAAGTSQRGAEDAYATQLFGSNTCVRRAL